ncbi:MAG TPA: hypothetical protein VJJ47_01455 [Candidatus Paceibacterota bacterium]
MKGKKKAAKVTLDGLAAMVAEGFSHMGIEIKERFKEVDERFEGVESRLGSVESRLGSVESKLGSVESQVSGLYERIDYLADSRPRREEFDKLEGRVATLESRKRR